MKLLLAPILCLVLLPSLTIADTVLGTITGPEPIACSFTANDDSAGNEFVMGSGIVFTAADNEQAEFRTANGGVGVNLNRIGRSADQANSNSVLINGTRSVGADEFDVADAQIINEQQQFIEPLSLDGSGLKNSSFDRTSGILSADFSLRIDPVK